MPRCTEYCWNLGSLGQTRGHSVNREVKKQKVFIYRSLPGGTTMRWHDLSLLTLSKHTVCSPNHEIKYEWKNKLVPEDEANSAFWDEWKTDEGETMNRAAHVSQVLSPPAPTPPCTTDGSASSLQSPHLVVACKPEGNDSCLPWSLCAYERRCRKWLTVRRQSAMSPQGLLKIMLLLLIWVFSLFYRQSVVAPDTPLVTWQHCSTSQINDKTFWKTVRLLFDIKN